METVYITKSVLITRVLYILYIILLELLSIFLLSVYRRKDDIYLFILLLLLKMLSNIGWGLYTFESK